MAGNQLGSMKAQTNFGGKGYKPGSMISKMNTKNPALKSKKNVSKLIKGLI